MRRQGERLRRVSGSVLAEVDPPDDRHRPLEWRCDWKTIHYELSNLRLVETLEPCNTELRSLTEDAPTDKEAFLRELKPKHTIRTRIIGTPDIEDSDSHLVYAVPETKGGDVFYLEDIASKVEVEIRAAAPREGQEARVLLGSAFRLKFPGEDVFHFSLALDQEEFNRVVTSLQDGLASLSLSISILAFSHEADDLLAEVWMTRTLVILEPDATPCVISAVTVSLPIGEQHAVAEQDHDEGEEGGEVGEAPDEDDRTQAAEELNRELLLATLGRHVKSQERLVIAAWCLIAVVVVWLLL